MRKQNFQWTEMTMGVCYYPEWNKAEPEEGKFTYTFFDEFLDVCLEEKMNVIFGTPTATPPAWLTEKYPEVLNGREDDPVLPDADGDYQEV